MNFLIGFVFPAQALDFCSFTIREVNIDSDIGKPEHFSRPSGTQSRNKGSQEACQNCRTTGPSSYQQILLIRQVLVGYGSNSVCHSRRRKLTRIRQPLCSKGRKIWTILDLSFSNAHTLNRLYRQKRGKVHTVSGSHSG
jgi:hypothetical protein